MLRIVSPVRERRRLNVAEGQGRGDVLDQGRDEHAASERLRGLRLDPSLGERRRRPKDDRAGRRRKLALNEFVPGLAGRDVRVPPYGPAVPAWLQ